MAERGCSHLDAIESIKQPQRRETAKNAVGKVTQLQPNLGEAFLAEGYFHYYCEQNYDAAIASFEKARQLTPGSSETLEALALVSRRKGEWQRSLEYFRQATEIDPRNISLLGWGQLRDEVESLRRTKRDVFAFDALAAVQHVSDCVDDRVWLAVPKTTEWQRIGN